MQVDIEPKDRSEAGRLLGEDAVQYLLRIGVRFWGVDED
jgi:hypothetical protein